MAALKVLQTSATGAPDAAWSRAVCKVDPDELRAWMEAHPSKLHESAASTGRDNYGLVGKAGKKTKNHAASAARSAAFQAAHLGGV